MGKIINVSILGCGSRGAWAYGQFMHQLKDKYKIVSICDIDEYTRKHVSEEFEVDKENVFADENEFFKEKRSDLLVIATQDKDHVRQAKRALELGYNLLLEKPISKYLNELQELKEYAEKYNRTVIVCHVLRYSVQIRKLMEIIKSGRIGRIISIQHLEQVAFFHQAHSFVRGSWRSSEESAPMIMAKTCHDLDLLQAFAGSKCKKVSSMGSLAFFNKDNAPEGAAKRCIDCKYVDTCEYSAKTIYLKWWQEAGRPASMWLPSVMCGHKTPLTDEMIEEGLKTSPYGRCVFYCDNDVVDNQIVEMEFENGITASLTMTAFTKHGGRYIRFFGTKGELLYDEEKGYIEIKEYLKDIERIMVKDLEGDLSGGHGGSDHNMILGIYEVLTGNKTNLDTSLENSIESHLMAIAAERSRLNGGAVVEIKDLR